MPLKTFVKVGSITNLGDARYCAGMGVNMVGFQTIEVQESYIKPDQFQEIRGWITGPLVVAEIYGMKSSSELAFVLENYKPDYLEMGKAELSLFSLLPLPFILSLKQNEDIQDISLRPAYLISQNSFETDIPLLIEIQSKPELQKHLSDLFINGFVLYGSNEIRPGLKNFEAMMDVLELLEIEN